MAPTTKEKKIPVKKIETPEEKINKMIAETARNMGSGQTLSDVAKAFIKDHQHDSAFIAWVQSEVQSIVHERMRSFLRSDRSAAHHNASRASFQDSVDPLARTPFQVAYRVNELNEWKQLGAMKRDDLLYVSDDYKNQSNKLAFEAAFFTAVAKRVGTKTVSEKFNVKSLQALRESIVA